MFSREIFSERLKTLRSERSLTQNDLAEMIHYDTSKVRRIEQCRQIPSVLDLIVIAELFDVSTDYLLGLEERM